MTMPMHRRHLILIAISVALLAVGSFVSLMRKLEREPSSASTPTAMAQIPQVASSAVATSTTGSDVPRGVVIANGRQIPVELALDQASQERGLSYRASLPGDEGMLFLLGVPQQQMFWMNGMRFPIDMIFINGTRVVRVAADVPAPVAGEIPAVVSSLGDADKVLEVNAGKSEEWGIRKGTEMTISGIP